MQALSVGHSPFIITRFLTLLFSLLFTISTTHSVSSQGFLRNLAINVTQTLNNEELLPVQPFQIQIPKGLFTDPEAENIEYEASLLEGGGLPDWVGFNPETLVLNGVAPQTGNYEFEIIGKDKNGEAIAPFNITVVSAPPKVFCQSVYTYPVNQEFKFKIQIEDPNGNPFTYNVSQPGNQSLPSCVNFEHSTKTFSGKCPNVEQYIITVTATDQNNNKTSQTSFNLNIAGQLQQNYNITNVTFYLGPIPEQWTIPNDLFSSSQLKINATRADGTPLPDWIVFYQNNNTFQISRHENNFYPLNVELKVLSPLGQMAMTNITFITRSAEVLMNLTQPDFTVNSFRPSSQAIQFNLLLQNGNFMVVWESYLQDGSGYGIYARILNQNGTGPNEFRINTETANNQFYPSAINLNNGSVMFVYESDWEMEEEYAVYGKIFDENEEVARDEFQISDPSIYTQAEIKIGQTENGNILCAWEGEHLDGSMYGVFAKLYNPEGAQLSSQIQVNNFTKSSQKLPRVYVQPNYNFLIVWISKTQDGSEFGVFGKIMTPNGEFLQREEFQVNTYWMNNQIDPKVVFLQNGNVFYIWQSQGQDGSGWGIIGKIVDQENNVVVPEFIVNDNTQLDQINAEIRVLNNSNVFIAWQTQRANDSVYQIAAKIFDQNGRTVRHEFQVNQYWTQCQFVNLAVTLLDNFIFIGWENVGEDGSGLGIFAKVLDFNGDSVKDEFQVNNYTQGWQFNIQPLMLANRKVFAGWTTATNGYSWDVEGKVYQFFLDLLPDILRPLMNQNALVNKTFSYQIPSSDIQMYENATYITNSTLVGGSPLPSWLAYNPSTLTFSGVPATPDVGNLSIQLNVIDSNGGEVSESYELFVTEGPIPVSNSEKIHQYEETYPEDTGFESYLEESLPHPYVPPPPPPTPSFWDKYELWILLAILAMACCCSCCTYCCCKPKESRVRPIPRDPRQRFPRKAPVDSESRFDGVTTQDVTMTDSVFNPKPNYDIIPENFYCPLTKGIMATPWIVVSDDQLIINSYEKDAVEGWFKKYDIDPITKLKKRWMGENFPLKISIEKALCSLSASQLKGEPILRSKIGDWIRRKGVENLRSSPELRVILDNYNKSSH